MFTRRFQAAVHREGDVYVAVCSEMGTASRGYTFGEAIANLAGGMRFQVAGQAERGHGTTVVTVTTFESEGQAEDDGQDASGGPAGGPLLGSRDGQP